MSISEALKSVIVKKSAAIHRVKETDPKPVVDNPYLTARRTWNENVGALVSSRQTWQVVGILSLLIALAGVGGMIHFGSRSVFVPYVIEVDKLGQIAAAGPVTSASIADPRILHAFVATFMGDARLVTPDVALQRKAVFRVYSMLSPNDPATAKMNEWLNGNPNANPFERAEREAVSTEVISVLPQTPDTWQVDWVETTRDRQGVMKGQPVRMRALVTVYTVEATPQTTEEHMRNNPLGIYVRDFAWSRLPL